MKYAQLVSQCEASVCLVSNSCYAEIPTDSFEMHLLWFSGLGGGFCFFNPICSAFGSYQAQWMLAGVTLSHPIPVINTLTASRLPTQHPFSPMHTQRNMSSVSFSFEHIGFSFLKRLYLQLTMISFALFLLKILSVMLCWAGIVWFSYLGFFPEMGVKSLITCELCPYL